MELHGRIDLAGVRMRRGIKPMFEIGKTAESAVIEAQRLSREWIETYLQDGGN